MGDATVKEGSEFKARGLLNNYLMPAVLGMFVTVFFFHFVPEMIGQLDEGHTFKIATRTAVREVFTPYGEMIAGKEPWTFKYLAWPIVGMIAGVFMHRLLTRL